MYRRSKFLEVLIAIREEMATEADHDIYLFAEMVRSGRWTDPGKGHDIRPDEKQRTTRQKRNTQNPA